MTSFSIFHSLLDDCGVEKMFCLKSVKCQYHQKCQRILIFGLDPISDSTCKLKHLSLQAQKAMHCIIISKIKIKNDTIQNSHLKFDWIEHFLISPNFILSSGREIIVYVIGIFDSFL